MNIESSIDHTILKPTTTIADIKLLCEEAIQYQFAAVCVPPYFVKDAAQILAGTNIKVATVIGFPLGYSSIAAKEAEVRSAIAEGADEIDLVINIAALKAGNWDYLSKEITTLLQPIRLNQKIVKVIIESGILIDNEVIHCCKLYAKHKVDFVKTSTGYAEKGADAATVRLMRNNLPAEIKIKASGGIRTFAFAKELIEAGAERIGTSAGVAIVAELRAERDI